MCLLLWFVDASGRQQRSFPSSPPGRHSAPSRIGRSLLPSPSVDAHSSSCAGGRQPTTVGETPSVVAGRRAAESSPGTGGPRPDHGVLRKTQKARPAVGSASLHNKPDLCPADELPDDDEFALREVARKTDHRRR